MSDNKEIEIRSEEVQDILTRVPHWLIRWGNTIVFCIILLLFAFSWFIKYPDTIVSQAMITTKTPPQKEYAKTNARIQHLLVNDNDIVSAGQVLAVLENPADYKDVFYLKSVLDTIKTNYDSFEFPIEELPALFLGSLETDFAIFQNNYIQYQLNKELKPYNVESLAYQISKSELQNRMITLENQKALNKGELDFKKSELQRYQSLFEKGIIALQDYENKQLEYLQAERNYKNIDIALSQLKESVSTTDKNIKGTDISGSIEEIKLLKSVIQSFHQLKKSIRDWELQYALISNIDGKVSFVNIWNENQTVHTGEMILSINPINHSEYVTWLKTPVQNSGKVIIGQKVHIRLQNFPEDEFGVIEGLVKNISLLPDSEGFYTVEVAISNLSSNNQKLVTSYNKEINFSQEMQGTAEIITEELRLIERFFYQLRRIFDK